MNILLKISLIFKFIFDKKIPLKEKWMIIIPAIYIISPIDLIPEPILGFGFIDDIIMLVFLFSIIREKTKKYYGKKDTDVEKEKIIENVEYEFKDDEEKK